MQLLLLALVFGLFLYDALPGAGHRLVLAGGWIVVIVLAPKLVLAGIEALAAGLTRRRLGTASGLRRFERLHRLFAVFYAVTLGLYAVDLAVGGLTLVRLWVGNLVLVDALIFLAPTLGLIVWSWVVYYPIERRLREATIFARADQGLPICAIPSRGQYVLGQVRHHLGLILLPLLLILGWSQVVARLGPGHWALLAAAQQTPVFMGGAVVVFVLMPLIIALVWDTTALPAGEIRQCLTALCQAHGVRVRNLLLWRTGGTQVNAAVIGLIAPLRYILVTDALLETVVREQVEAVMAHEIAHVRLHHMFWLLAAAAGSLGLLELPLDGLLAAGPGDAGPSAGWGLWTSGSGPWLAAGAVVVIAAVWIAVFGYVSRRFERQADAFAVQHLARRRQQAAGQAGGAVVIEPEAAGVMIDALGRTAAAGGQSIQRRNWRHGSIAWRQAYLRGLVGQRVDRLAIDRHVRWIKLASAAAVTLAVMAWWV